jgi:adenylylsulfate kinase-like enzyme
MTGVNSPYEAPENPDLEIDTSATPVSDLALQVIDYLMDKSPEKSNRYK